MIWKDLPLTSFLVKIYLNRTITTADRDFVQTRVPYTSNHTLQLFPMHNTHNRVSTINFFGREFI